METNQNLIKLINVLNADVEKAGKFSNKKTKKELYKYCISLVSGYSEREFTGFMKNLSVYSECSDNPPQIPEKFTRKSQKSV